MSRPRAIGWSAAIVLAVLIQGLNARTLFSPDLNDFGRFWASSRAVLDGRSPYIPVQPPDSGRPGVDRNLNSPPFVYALAPLGLFAPRTALAIWAVDQPGCDGRRLVADDSRPARPHRPDAGARPVLRGDGSTSENGADSVSPRDSHGTFLAVHAESAAWEGRRMAGPVPGCEAISRGIPARVDTPAKISGGACRCQRRRRVARG